MAKIIRKNTDDFPGIPEQRLITVSQACNEFRLRGTTRLHVLKKFKEDMHTVNEWNNIFYRERVL